MLIESTLSADQAQVSWRDALLSAHREGYVFLDLLTVVDRTDLATDTTGPWEFIAHVVRPTDHARRWICRIEQQPRIDSVANVFAAAAWHEREVGEMFGIEFTGEKASGDPLLLSTADDGRAPAYPLRKSTPLIARITTPWPGVHEPGAKKARRPMRPPGVPSAWLTAHEDQQRGDGDG
jgi:NADH-quinone oxidoreductase subunit C